MFGDLVSKVYKLGVEAVLSDSYCYKPTCFLLETFAQVYATTSQSFIALGPMLCDT